MNSINQKDNSKKFEIIKDKFTHSEISVDELEKTHIDILNVPKSSLIKDSRILEEFKISKNYTMKIDGGFDYESFGEKFDFAIAQSVVTHMSVRQIDELLDALKKVMKPDGIFLFTFINNRFPYSVYYEMEEPMITPSNLDNAFFQTLEKKYQVEYRKYPEGLEHHPTGQAVATIKF